MPYTYSRLSQKPCWKNHLKALKEKVRTSVTSNSYRLVTFAFAQGHCLGIRKDGYRTLVRWCNAICKKRIAFRLKEKSDSGRAAVEPPTATDTVAGKRVTVVVIFLSSLSLYYYCFYYVIVVLVIIIMILLSLLLHLLQNDTDYWHSFKIATDLQSAASNMQARIIREAALTTNTPLIHMGLAIEEARRAAHRARTPRVNSREPTPTTHDPQRPRADRDGNCSDTQTVSELLSPQGRGPPNDTFTPDQIRGAMLSPFSAAGSAAAPAPNRSTNAHNVREMLGSSMATGNVVSSQDINLIVDRMFLRGGQLTPSVPAQSPSIAVPVQPKSKLERLRELRELLESEEITQLEHDENRSKILSS